MASIVIGLVIVVTLALVVVGVVAYPHLREGAPLLTSEGGRLAHQARQRAQGMAGSAVERAAGAASSLRGAATGQGGAAVDGVQVRSWDSVVAEDAAAARFPAPEQAPETTSAAAGGSTPGNPPSQLRPLSATPPPGTPLRGDASGLPAPPVAGQTSGSAPDR